MVPRGWSLHNLEMALLFSSITSRSKFPVILWNITLRFRSFLGLVNKRWPWRLAMAATGHGDWPWQRLAMATHVTRYFKHKNPFPHVTLKSSSRCTSRCLSQYSKKVKYKNSPLSSYWFFYLMGHFNECSWGELWWWPSAESTSDNHALSERSATKLFCYIKSVS